MGMQKHNNQIAGENSAAGVVATSMKGSGREVKHRGRFRWTGAARNPVGGAPSR